MSFSRDATPALSFVLLVSGMMTLSPTSVVEHLDGEAERIRVSDRRNEDVQIFWCQSRAGGIHLCCLRFLSVVIRPYLDVSDN